MVVVATGRDERSLVADALRHVEAENVAIEGERPVDVRDLEVDVADVDARVDAHRGDDTASWKRERWIRSRPQAPTVLRAPRSGTVERCEREHTEREQHGLDLRHPKHPLPFQRTATETHEYPSGVVICCQAEVVN